MTISDAIYALCDYAVKNSLIEACDKVYIINSLMDVSGLDALEARSSNKKYALTEILSAFCDNAVEKGIITEDIVTRRDLYDTRVMGIITPRPSEVIRKFYSMPVTDATRWFYKFSQDCNYIRADRISKNVCWQTATEYGDMEITINLSKPEKDPRDIAAAGKATASGYPKCVICVENEGFAGDITRAARQNIRLMPIILNGEEFFFQYSPYVYYNEHCIVLNKNHIPMKVDKQTFRRLADFVTLFPHYFIGSNADKPIVGGSILSHDHYQGGRHVFPMEKAAEAQKLALDRSGKVYSAVLNWPMSVLRLRSADRERLIDVANVVLEAWNGYSDAYVGIIAEDRFGLHNAVTPIFRRRGSDYEADIVLRNNRTTPEYPLGVFHPHADKHHIKKENIGLIEVMGLAILPPRLKSELETLKHAMLCEAEYDESVMSHKAWAEDILLRRSDFCKDNADDILCDEVGKVFKAVLEDAGVFKRDCAGKDAFDRFIRIINV